ncbi:MAG: hypothetical protein R2911_19920 [Caldilineaceae bacterium]
MERAAVCCLVFDYDYADIAQIVEKSEANCRQLVIAKTSRRKSAASGYTQEVQHRLLSFLWRR